MRLMNSFFIAMSTYSRIPMPQAEWNEENRKYVICFFPFAGVIIGAAAILFVRLMENTAAGDIFKAAILSVIPVIISGGIHVDGYMDIMDAFHSYLPKEEKLRILKDPHIGAFSVISLLTYYIVYIACIAEIDFDRYLLLFALSFVLSRTLSGIGAVYFKSAKSDGMLYSFSSVSHKKTVRAVLIIIFSACAAAAVVSGNTAGALMCAADILVFLYYKHKAYKELGGVTGDAAGWFLQLSELAGAIVIAAFSII